MKISGARRRNRRRSTMSTLRRVVWLACLACALAPAAPAMAQDYPVRPIRVIVPFGAGGPTDVFTRVLGEELRKVLKQPLVMENRPGAGTVIGTEVAAKSSPDGYTLLMISATQTVNETLISNKAYHLMKDFVPVAQLFHSELVMVVPPALGVSTAQEFIALAKSKPGQLNYASSGIGSNYHMAGELFKNLTGTDIVHVPYRGSSGARTDILAGNVQMMFDSIPTMAPFIEAGKVKALGTSGSTRSVALPGVPTLAETAIPGYQATIWIGMVAPAGTPQPIVDLLNREINKIISRPDIKDAWIKQDAKPDPMTPAQFGEHIQSEIDKWAKLIKANNIKSQ
jgi:tripartite-type tricarboxylate transporter receptor subunit TctC